MDKLSFEYLSSLVQTLDWVQVSVFTLFGVFFGYVFHLILNDSHRVERAMAKKAERKKIAEIVEDALDSHVRQGSITSTQRQKYCEIIGKTLKVDDIRPIKDRPKIIYYPNGAMLSIPKFYATKTKNAIVKRLTAMGVDVHEGLNKLRRSRKISKKERVLSSLKKTT